MVAWTAQLEAAVSRMFLLLRFVALARGEVVYQKVGDFGRSSSALGRNSLGAELDYMAVRLKFVALTR